MKSEEKILRFKDIAMHYTVQGEGKPLILMHGWGCEGATLNSLVASGIASGYKVYNVDFPGFGKSEEPNEVWGVNDYAKIIEELIKKEGLENPVIAGHSFGGRVAIMLGSRNKFEKIILIDSAGIKPHRKLSYYYKVYKFKLAKKLWKLVMGNEAYERIVNEYRKKKGSADYANSSNRMRQILSKVVNEDLTYLLPRIKAPTLLIWGTADTATPITDARKMKRLIPEAGLVELQGAGHYSFLESPVKFHGAFRYFLTH